MLGGLDIKTNRFNALNLFINGSICGADEAVVAAKMADVY